MEETGPRTSNNRRRSANNVSVWEDKLFRRAKAGLRFVIPPSERVSILQALRYYVGHWD